MPRWLLWRPENRFDIGSLQVRNFHHQLVFYRAYFSFSFRPCPCPGGPGSGYQHADSCYLDPVNQNVFCNCRPGYEGLKCEKCAANYFGSPNEIGGSCEKCDCNGNIDYAVEGSCDAKTGRCLKCLFHSEGFQCENCVAGYFGDATKQQCVK